MDVLPKNFKKAFIGVVTNDDDYVSTYYDRKYLNSNKYLKISDLLMNYLKSNQYPLLVDIILYCNHNVRKSKRIVYKDYNKIAQLFISRIVAFEFIAYIHQQLEAYDLYD